ncbi:MAG: 3-deoxy-manno-octulosonate cytidylyltransferase, partial [Thermoguttaceae bacterium]
MLTHIVIPARLASTRLPRKMLLAETGKPLVQYAYEAATKSRLAGGVCIACDDQEIFDTVQKFGGTAIMTDPNAQSGTDRIAEVARSMPNVDIFVNVQGDEPEMDPAAIDAVIQKLIDSPDCQMATACTPIREKSELENPACVKVVFDQTGKALYFSRSVIPHARTWSDDLLQAEPPLFYLHLGLYAYR